MMIKPIHFISLAPLTLLMGCMLGDGIDDTNEFATAGKQLFVSPNGGSNAKCTSSAPCSVQAGIDKAQNGDQVIFKNGTYRIAQIKTKRAGVTFRAQNAHAAKIIGTSQGTAIVEIRHSNTVVKGFELECQDRARGITLHNGTYKNIRIENNRVLGAYQAGIKIGQRTTQVDGVVVAGNYVEKTGTGHNAEGIYIGASSGDASSYARNVEVMGNEFALTPENGIDCKEGNQASNIKIHHNVFRDFQKQPWSDRNQTGVIACSGKNVDIYRNYFHDGTVDMSVIRVSANSDIRVYENLFENISGTRELMSHKSPQPTNAGKTIIEDNHFKNVSATRAEQNSGWIVRDNFGFDKPLDNAKFRSLKDAVMSKFRSIRNQSARVALAGDAHVDGEPVGVAAGELADHATDRSNTDAAWLTTELDSAAVVTSVDVSWARTDLGPAYVEIQLSDDGTRWTTVFAGTSAADSEIETLDVVDGSARHLRIRAEGEDTAVPRGVARMDAYGF